MSKSTKSVAKVAAARSTKSSSSAGKSVSKKKSVQAKKGSAATKSAKKPDAKTLKAAAASKTIVKAKPVAKAKATPATVKKSVAKASPAQNALKAIAAAAKAAPQSAKVVESEVVATVAAATSEAAKVVAKQPSVRLNAKDLEYFRRELMKTRNRLTGKIIKMRESSLKRDDEVNPEEDGTDAFDRLFALERAGGDQRVVNKIDEALRAIEEGIYGVCQECGELIQKPRLLALPFAKNCIECQTAHERKGGSRSAAPRRFVP